MKKKKLEVHFGAVVIGTSVSIPITIPRSAKIDLADIDALFTGRRLTGSIVARPEKAHAGQNGLFGADGDLTIEGEFDARKYGGSAKEFSTTLILHAQRFEALKFRNRNGLLVIDAIGEIPASAPKVEEPEEEEEPANA